MREIGKSQAKAGALAPALVLFGRDGFPNQPGHQPKGEHRVSCQQNQKKTAFQEVGNHTSHGFQSGDDLSGHKMNHKAVVQVDCIGKLAGIPE